MKRIAILCAFLVALSPLSLCQDITNTLGINGTFTIEDGTSTFFSIGQISGHATFSNNITIGASTAASIGIIFKGPNRFIHDFKKTGTSGDNTFLGVNAGNFTMTGASTLDQGSQNTATGFSTLTSLTTGKRNQAFGYRTLFTNNSGQSNSAYGDEAMYANTSGSSNAAVGGEALYSNQTGSYNSAVGVLALSSNTASYNTAIGYSAGTGLTTGSNNTLVGYNSQPSSASVFNEITLGNGSIATLRCQQTSITALSDARDKKEIADLSLGLDFIMSIRPRQFNWDRREWYEDGQSDGSKAKEQPTAGFIAQELDEAQTSADAEWLNLVLKSNPEKLEATPGNLLPVIVKAIQELNSEVNQLRATQEALLKENSKLRAENDAKTSEKN